MNPNNYGSLEASQRLHAAGIVLETEKVWGFRDGIWSLFDRAGIDLEEVIKHIPAPSPAEVWRELPHGVTLMMAIRGWWGILPPEPEIALIELFRDIDLMINLLIFVEQRKDIEAKKDYDYERSRP
jgi:hypothetical protein